MKMYTDAMLRKVHRYRCQLQATKTLQLRLAVAVTQFLADRTNGRAYATVLRLSVVRRLSSVVVCL